MTPTAANAPVVLRKAVKGWAVLGGCGLVVAGVLTVLSILGRALSPFGLQAISGDFELVELATGIAVFGFLGWGHLEGQHVRVEVVTHRLPARLNAILGGISEFLMALVAGVILWRLYLGFAEKFPYGGESLRNWVQMGSKPYFPETTYELQIEIWIPYLLCLIGAALFFLVALERLRQSLRKDPA